MSSVKNCDSCGHKPVDWGAETAGVFGIGVIIFLCWVSYQVGHNGGKEQYRDWFDAAVVINDQAEAVLKQASDYACRTSL